MRQKLADAESVYYNNGNFVFAFGGQVLLGSDNHEKEETRHLEEAAEKYILAGEMTYAMECLERVRCKSVHILYDKALCCYAAGMFAECYELLKDAEGRLPSDIPGRRMMPDTMLKAEYAGRFRLSLMPENAPDVIKLVQILRLKAECAAQLGLYGDINAINVFFNCRYNHISNLMEKEQNENEGN